MKSVLHKANSRGHANHGWLNSYHSFSFAGYYNPDRMNFGALRVLNDDEVAPGMGFGTHPHDNMEIISIPLEGDLEHKDNMGNKTVIKQGDVQVMSAGTGIAHSEYNHNDSQAVRFLQIWIIPDKRNVTPRYDQISLKPAQLHNRWQQILSPQQDDEGVWIHQQAWFHLGHLSTGLELEYELKNPENGVYAFILEGQTEIAGETLNRRDAIGIWDTEAFSVKALENSQLLLMEVPLKFD